MGLSKVINDHENTGNKLFIHGPVLSGNVQDIPVTNCTSVMIVWMVTLFWFTCIHVSSSLKFGPGYYVSYVKAQVALLNLSPTKLSSAGNYQ